MKTQTCGVMAVVLSVSLSCGLLRAQVPTLFLKSKPLFLEQQVRGIVPRELVRQAILITATDLGWKTRDATLREVVSPETADAVRLSVEISLEGRTISAELKQEDKVVWANDFDIGEEPDFYRPLVKRLQQQVAGKLKSSLAGLAPEFAKSPQSATKEENDAWTDHTHEMHLIKQFVVARHRHREIHRDNNSENLSALARAYANLALLSRHHWFASSGAFTARSLLYSERAVTAAETEVAQQNSRWSRAYCNALCGRHADALADMEDADGAGVELPVWGQVIIPSCQFHHEALAKLATDSSPVSAIAAVLNFEACRSRDNEVLFKEAAELAAEHARFGMLLYAECAKRDRSFEIRRWAGDAGVTAVNGSLRSAFKFAQGISAETKAKLRELKLNDELVFPRVGGIALILLASPDELETSDLSWQMLGRLIQEEMFVASVGMLADARNAVKSDLSPYTNTIVSQLPDHPYRHFVQAWGYDLETQQDEFLKAVDQLTFVDPRPHMSDQLYVLWQTPSSKYQAIGQAATRMALPDYTEHSMGDRAKSFWLMPRYAQSYEKLFGMISPHSPKLLRCSILSTKDYTDEQFAEWKNRAIEEKDSAALLVLHERIRSGKKWVDTSRSLLEPLVKLEPKPIYARMLAERHLMKGDRNAWRQALTDYLEVDSESFGSTQIANDLAKRLMTERKWQDAKPYAEIAASTFSSWGLESLARCLEGLDEFEQSEIAVSKATKSYGDASRQFWYLWCKRNDRGDLESARKFAKDYYARARSALEYEFKSIYLQLEGKKEAALEAMLQANQRTPSYWNEMEIAMLAYDLDKKALREKALEDLRVRCEQRPSDLLLAQLVQLSRLEENDELKTDVIDTYLRPENWDVKCDVAYFTGEWMIRHGEPKRAEGYLDIARWSEVERLTPTVAAVRLRELEKQK